MSRELLYALGAALLAAAGAIGWLLRDRSARAPAVERVDAAAVELQRRQDQAAAVRAAAAIEQRDQAASAARQRQEAGTRATRGVDADLAELGAEPRVRQESAPGPTKPRP